MGAVRADNLTIRQGDVADCDVLTALMLRSRAYTGRYRRMIEAYPVTPAMVHKNEVWVAERHRQPIGFYRLDVANADLDLMFVDDAVQGAGIGRTIFMHMQGFAAKCGLGRVRIVAHPPAVEFYRRMGAIDVGVSKAAHADGWVRPILELRIGQ